MLNEVRGALGDRYRIERELGRGGMGAVYLARDIRLDRPVALKVLPPEVAAQPVQRDRFVREIRTAAGFSHPNIVPVYAVEDTGNLLAYAMGFVEGESLAARVARLGPLGPRDAVRLIQDVAYALAYAHGRGVVHRDIKPDNVMIERATGRALVMDFGIARAMASSEGDPGLTQLGLTRLGEVVGTPEYMSPEQATGDAVDGRSDLYSLGLTAYFALTGRSVMHADSIGKIIAKQVSETPPPLQSVRSDVPAALAAAIDRCLAKDPAARFASAEALVETLDEAQLAGPEIPLSIRLLANEIGALSLVLVGGFLISYFIALQALTRDRDNVDMLLPIVVLAGVLMTRVLQTRQEARRIFRDGFSIADVMRGFAAVLAESEARREELRGDPATQRARRKTIRAAIAMLAGSIAMFIGGLSFRTAMPSGGYHISRPGVALVVSATMLLGVSGMLLVRSPFRMKPGERLFRLVWMGPIGRLFMRVAARGVPLSTASPHFTVAGASPHSRSPAAPTGVARSASIPDVRAAAAPAAIDRLSALEARVGELERWRQSRDSSSLPG